MNSYFLNELHFKRDIKIIKFSPESLTKYKNAHSRLSDNITFWLYKDSTSSLISFLNDRFVCPASTARYKETNLCKIIETIISSVKEPGLLKSVTFGSDVSEDLRNFLVEKIRNKLPCVASVESKDITGMFMLVVSA